MPDEIPPAPSESEDASKAETIRITLPPKQEQQAVKRETVRINLPGKPVPPSGIAPKKETTKLGEGTSAFTPPPAPPAGSAPKPFMPPPKPPAPPSAPGIPGSGMARPLAGAVPPKPPTLGARPTVPLKPAPGPMPSGLGAGPTPAPAPALQKAAAPKKETARITLPPEGSAKPNLPKATVKMQQTQPLKQQPMSTITPAIVPTTSLAPVGAGAPDSAVNAMSIAALLVSLAAVAFAYFAYNAASL